MRDTFFGSQMVQDAVARNLQTLAEPSQRLSDATRAREPSVPWRSISGLRNVLAHGYLGLDPEAVWSIVDTDNPYVTGRTRAPARRAARSTAWSRHLMVDRA